MSSPPPQIPKIIDEDEHLCVLEKPAAWPSVAAKPGTLDPKSVEGWLQARYPAARLVHRLDNETSGLMLAAKTTRVWEHLRKIWKTEAVVKKYRALVVGKTPPSGTISTPIAHHPRKKKKMVPGGKKARPALTQYKTLRHFKDYSLIEIRITTGVRHQIRVHLASIGHPVAGDKIYAKTPGLNSPWPPLTLRGGKGTPPLMLRGGQGELSRHCLHLGFLQLRHPATGKTKTWTSEISFL